MTIRDPEESEAAGLLENLNHMERAKLIKLMGTRTIRACEESLSLINEYINALIEGFRDGNPSERDFERLRQVNLSCGEMGARLIRAKMMLDEDFDKLSLWVLGEAEDKRQAKAHMMQIKREVDNLAEDVVAAQNDCSELGAKVMKWRKERRERAKPESP